MVDLPRIAGEHSSPLQVLQEVHYKDRKVQKMKRLALILLSATLLLSMAACSSEAPENTVRPTEATAETAPPTAEPPPSAEPEPVNQIQLDMDLDGGRMTVVAEYEKDSLPGSIFLLNRAFEVTKILCDGQEINVDEIKELRTLWGQYNDPEDYPIHVYRLPPFETDLRIEYSGTLDGTTGPDSYVWETISPEFTLLRSPTFFHPRFIDVLPDNEADLSDEPFDLRMTVTVPEGYTAAFSRTKSEEETTTPAGSAFMASFNARYHAMAVAIAKYHKVETEYANFFLLENSGIDPSLIEDLPSNVQIKEVISNSTFATFGEDNAFKTAKIVEIPEGLGWDAYLRFATGPGYFWSFGALPLWAAETQPLSFPKFEGDSCSMLFVGDSYTIAVPAQLKAVASLYGIDIHFDNASVPSSRLYYSNVMNRTLEYIENNQYDFVVVAADVWMDYETQDIHYAEVERIFNAAREKGSTPVLYLPGEGRSSYTDADGRIVPSHAWRMSDVITAVTVAKRLDAILVNASEAWVYAYEQNEDISLFRDDAARHASLEGVYYTACVLASTLFDLHIQDIMDAEGIGEIYPDWYNIGLYAYTGENALALGQSAWEFVTWYKEHQTYPG
jgi:hypothetical protein